MVVKLRHNWDYLRFSRDFFILAMKFCKRKRMPLMYAKNFIHPLQRSDIYANMYHISHSTFIKGGDSMPKKPINHYEHPDKLPNNPTQELSGFAEEEEYAPTRYPRDTALDPQLVWKGKDQQNDSDLEVPTVPIYTQEHIQPQAIIENLRAQQLRESDQTEMLFEGFNDLDFAQKIEFYQHEQNWHNRFILGDSLAVMNSLAEKGQLKGGVQMIYFDPPYGIKFSSNWQVSTRKRDVSDTKAEDVTPQPEQVKAFRDTWELGIHSYLAYLRDRLTVAHELLTDSGSIFVQISDENVHRVRCILDEVFGEANFVSTIAWTRGTVTSADGLASVSDYLLWYAKDKKQVKYRQLYMQWDERKVDPLLGNYAYVEFLDGFRRGMKADEKRNPALLPEESRRFATYRITSQTGGSANYKYEFEGKSFTPPIGRGWSTSLEGLDRLTKQGRLTGTGLLLYYIRYASDFPGRAITNMWTDTGQGRSGKSYVVETNPKVIQRCILMTTDPGDLVLDPTCGSGTTAYLAEQWGRRWITIDTSRVALALARTRLMSAKYPYYRLENTKDIKQGFSYRTARHVSLSDMANNTEIDDIHSEYSEKLDPFSKHLTPDEQTGGGNRGKNGRFQWKPILNGIRNFSNCIGSGLPSNVNGNLKWMPLPHGVQKAKSSTMIHMKTRNGFVSRGPLRWIVCHRTLSWILPILRLLHQSLLLLRLHKIIINIFLSILKLQVCKTALKSNGLPSTG